MDVGLVGLPRSGKTTIFNLLTSSHAETNAFGGAKTETRRGMAPVPDPRLDRLNDLYHPKKMTPAQLVVVDVPGLLRSETGGSNKFLNDVRMVDALIHVVRGFTTEIGEEPTPLQDLENMELEMSLSDLELLEKRRERLRAGKKLTPENQIELGLVDTFIEALEAGQRLDQVALSEEAKRLVAGYQFLTLKPMLWVINVDDEAVQSGDYPDRDQILQLSRDKGVSVVLMAGALEQEMQDLPLEDRAEFMADLGLEESGIARMARAIYGHLGLMSFLTAGEDEVRAWTIQHQTTAKEAAGKIHSDIERGFIRAEIVAFNDLDQTGSMAKARDQGLVRLEGKEYVMQDGDIVNFRFNV